MQWCCLEWVLARGRDGEWPLTLIGWFCIDSLFGSSGIFVAGCFTV